MTDNLDSNFKSSLDFLIKEYENCYSHMRHYEINSLQIIKFSFILYSAVIPACAAMFQIFYEKNIQALYLFTSILTGITWFIGIGLIMLLLQNRKYFVLVAQQVNSIRKSFVERLDNKLSFENRLYLDSNYPIPNNYKSIQLVIIYLLTFISTVYLTFSIISFGKFIEPNSEILFLLFGCIISFLLFFLKIYFINRYLKKS